MKASMTARRLLSILGCLENSLTTVLQVVHKAGKRRFIAVTAQILRANTRLVYPNFSAESIRVIDPVNAFTEIHEIQHRAIFHTETETIIGDVGVDIKCTGEKDYARYFFRILAITLFIESFVAEKRGGTNPLASQSIRFRLSAEERIQSSLSSAVSLFSFSIKEMR